MTNPRYPYIIPNPDCCDPCPPDPCRPSPPRPVYCAPDPCADPTQIPERQSDWFIYVGPHLTYTDIDYGDTLTTVIEKIENTFKTIFENCCSELDTLDCILTGTIEIVSQGTTTTTTTTTGGYVPLTTTTTSTTTTSTSTTTTTTTSTTTTTTTTVECTLDGIAMRVS